MFKRLSRFIALLLVSILTIQTTIFNFSTVLAQSQDIAISDPELLDEQIEIQKNRYVNYITNADGSITAEINFSPIRYEDENGNWQYIDNTIIPNDNLSERESGLLYTNKSCEVDVCFANSASNSTLASASYGGKTFSFHPIRLTKNQEKYSLKADSTPQILNSKTKFVYSEQEAEKQETQSAPNYIHSREYASMLYENVYANGEDIKVTPSIYGLKEDIIIDKYSDALYAYDIHVEGMYGQLQDDGNVLFFDESTDELAGQIAAPCMYDSAEEQAESYDIDVQFSKISDGNYRYILTPSKDWMTAPERVYPITIDPSYTYQTDTYLSDSFVAEKYPTNNYNRDTQIKVGNSSTFNKSRGLFKIKGLNKMIGSGATIVSAEFKAYQDYSGASSPEMGLYAVSSDYNMGTVTWATQPTMGSQIAKTTVSTVGWYSWDIKNTLASWYKNNTYLTSFYLRNVNESANMYKRFRAQDYSTATTYIPKVVVTYITAPSSVTLSPTTWTNGNITVNHSSVSMSSGTVKYQYAVSSSNTSSPAASSFSDLPSPNAVSHSVSIPQGKGYVWVRTLYSGVASAAKCSSSQYMVDKTAPVAPASITLTGTSNPNEKILKWTGAADALSGLKNIQFKIGNGSYTTIASGASSKDGSYTFTSANADELYYFKVTDNAGNTKTVNVALSISAPTGLVAVPLLNNSICLTWDKSENTSLVYDVYRSEGDENNYSLIASDIAAPCFIDKGLTTRKIYYYKVKAKDGVSDNALISEFSSAANSPCVDASSAEEALGEKGYGEMVALDISAGSVSVNATNGNMMFTKSDSSTNSSKSSLSFTRIYNSKGDFSTLFGSKWDHSLNIFLSKSYDENLNESGIYLKDGSGALYFFAKSTDGYLTPAGIYATLRATDSGYTLQFKDEMTYSFDASGTLLSITDILGDSTLFKYDSSGRLIAVLNSLGHFIAIRYDDASRISSSRSGMDYDAFLSNENYECYNVYTYSYDANDRLIKVTDPSGSSEAYTYDSEGKLSSFYDANQLVNNEIDSSSVANCFAYMDGKLSSLIDTEGKKTTIAYASSGATVKKFENDAASVALSTCSYAYNSNNLLTAFTENGYTTSYTYDDKYNIISVQDPANGIEQNTYDSLGNLISTTDRAGNTTAYTYASGGIVPLTVAEDRGTLADKITHNTYNEYNQLTSSYIEGTKSKSFTYYITEPSSPAFGSVLKEITVTGEGVASLTSSQAESLLLTPNPNYYVTVTSYSYDAQANVITSQSGMGSDAISSTFTYFPGNNLKKSETSGGISTVYEYDALGNITQTLTGSAKNEATAYDELSNLVSETDPEGGVTETEYNDMNEEVKSTDPEDNITKIEYGLGTLDGEIYEYRLTKTLLKNSTASVSESLTVFDEHGNTLLEGDVWLNKNAQDDTNIVSYQKSFTLEGNIVKPLLNYTLSQYDALGNVISTTNEAGDAKNFSYDLMGNTLVEESITGNSKTRTQNTYDAAGQLLSTHTDKYEKDDSGNWTLAKGGVVTSYTYDLLGRVLSETQSLGQDSLTVNTYAYDLVENAQLVNTATDAKGRTQSKYSNSLGQLIREVKSGIGVYYTYDAAGRMHSATKYYVNEGVSGQSSVTTSYGYDSYGREARVNYETHYVTFTYDDNDNVLTASRYSLSDALENTISYQYDANGNLTSLTRNGETITYEYNENNDRTALNYASITAYTRYDDAGRQKEAGAYFPNSYGSNNEFYRVFSYTDDKLTMAREYRNSNYYIFNNYAYDGEGNLTNIAYGNRSYANDETHSISYDDEGRIISEDYTGYYGSVATPTSSIEKDYTYDWLGRLIKEVVNGVTTEYTYDEVGNLLTKKVGDEITEYTYNVHDQLEQITTGIVIENQYTYDISGNRITQKEYGITRNLEYDGQNNLTTINGSQTTYTTCTYDANGERLMRYNQTHFYYYYYDGVNLLFVKKDNAIDKRYLYDNEGNVYCAIANDGLPYWYHTDIRGSVTNILKGDSGTSSSPTLIRSYIYDAYGKTAENYVDSTNYFKNDIAYTGAVYDSETNLYYLMSRYYDPKAGSFISQDSYKGEGDAFWHLYAYCDGDPVNKTDRTGNRAYQMFSSANNAAIDFSKSVLPKARGSYGKSSREYGAFILKKTTNSKLWLDGISIPAGNKGKYFYTTVIKGKHATVNINIFINNYRHRWRGVDWQYAIHSHPACSCHINRIFSPSDRSFYKGYKYLKGFYLATPANMINKNNYSRYDTLYLITSPNARQRSIWQKVVYR